ncbi:MAG: ferritin-like domain-containing protein [Polyangiaceae bacterium]
MDRARMLALCESGQWTLDAIDWSRPPRQLSPTVEREVVQYFVDMAEIELFAGALFAEQRRRARDPVLRAIFESFVADEERHSRAAKRLAKHFNTRALQSYEPSASLLAFRPRFLRMLEHLSAEIANGYIVGGELILDIALLRSIDDYVDDPTCHDVIALINRDESRHVAVDYHMVEFYASPEWLAEEAAQPKRPVGERLRALASFAGVVATARPFIEDVFIAPMSRVDPGRRRMRDAFKRMQLLGAKPGVAARPFSRFLLTLQFVYTHPTTRWALAPLAERLVGVPGEYIEELYTKDEWARAEQMSFEELAREALSAKLS